MNKEILISSSCLLLFVLTFWLFFWVSAGVEQRFDILKDEVYALDRESKSMLKDIELIVKRHINGDFR